jgi:hypothetical protein
MRRFALVLLILLAIPSFSGGRGRQHRESHYRDIFCDKMGGVVEQISPSGTRADCVFSGYAVEVEFADKWAEGIGQALEYGASMGKTPGLVLIVGRGGERYVRRVREVASAYRLPLKIWQMDGRTGEISPAQR